MTSDLIVLVPGFLGFDEIGSFSYFDESVQEILRRRVSRRREDSRLAVARTLPAGTLLDRQKKLTWQLRQLDLEFAPTRIHLVGHSTGGMDAELITRSRTLASADWSSDDSFRAKLSTVVTCAAPLGGTWLSASPLGEFVSALGHEGILETLLRDGARDAAWIALTAVLAAATNPVVHGLTLSLFSDLGRSLPFLSCVWRHRELIAELHPGRVQEVYERAGPRSLDVRRVSIVTVAPPPRHFRPTIYAGLYRAIRDATPRASVSDAHLRALSAAARRETITAGWRPGAITAQSNDGVVNSSLQFLEDDELLVVAADHADVLGHFRTSGAPGGLSSLLDSGSAFRAPQARALFDRIAGFLS